LEPSRARSIAFSFVDNGLAERDDTGETCNAPGFFPAQRLSDIHEYSSGRGRRGILGDADDDIALHRYRTLVNTIDDGIYQVDTDGRFVAVNDVIVEATGYTRDELLGEHVSLVLADSDIERIEREISSQIGAPNEDDIATFDITVRTVDGDTIPYELRINLLLEDGTFRGSIGVARNRTEEQRRQESLASAVESYDSITSIIDKADIGVCILDENCEITWADETIEQYFAIDHERLVGRNNRTVIDDTLKHRFADADRSFAETVLSSYDDDHYVDRLECRVVDDGTDLEDRWLRYQSKPIESGSSPAAGSNFTTILPIRSSPRRT